MKNEKEEGLGRQRAAHAMSGHARLPNMVGLVR